MINHTLKKSGLALLAACTVLGSSLISDVKSTSGSIDFKVNSTSGTAATLDTNGLHLFTSTSSSNLSVGGNAIISERLQIGAAGTANSNLQLTGNMSLSVANATNGSTLDQYSYYLADTSSDNLSLTLPSTAGLEGRKITVKMLSASNNVVINGTNIDGNSAIVLSNRAAITLIKHSSGWAKMSSYGTVAAN